GIIRLKTTPGEDPRTNDFPFDIVSMTGCKGTSVLPATDAVCALDGDERKVVVTLRYRPIVAVTFAGESQVLSNPSISGFPGPGSVTGGVGFTCNWLSPAPTTTCAGHYSVGDPIVIRTR